MQFQEERQNLLKEKEDLEKKLNTTRDKVRNLTKKNKEQTDKINALSATARSNVLKRCNTQKSPFEVNELRVNVNSLKSNIQKQENIINELRNLLKNAQNELNLEKEKNQKSQTEISILKRKLSDSSRKNVLEVEDLQRKLKEQKECRREHKQDGSFSSKYSRNFPNQGLINFSIFTNSYKTESSISKSGLDIINISSSCDQPSSNVCSNCKLKEWMSEQLDYDPKKLVENRDMIKQVLCIGCSRFLTAKDFLGHVRNCRDSNNIPRLEQRLNTSRSEIFNVNSISNKLDINSEINLASNRKFEASPVETRASLVSPASKFTKNSKFSPLNHSDAQTKNMRNNWKRFSNMKTIDSCM